MFRIGLLFILIFTLSLNASKLQNKSLKSLISNMIIIGFEGESFPPKLKNHLKHHGIGGVILFKKNIHNPTQLKKLTSTIQKSSRERVMIAIDQEGGLVQRLHEKNGFISTPKPSIVAKMGFTSAQVIYTEMAQMLKEHGINVNFAPSVDLAINPKNGVIYRYGRSFSENPHEVILYAEIFMHAMKAEGILSVIKHFPGHGSSMEDSHEGFVDVTTHWDSRELVPFLKLESQAVMTAHIFNRHLDSAFPATLSQKTNAILRDSGFDGLLISDDLQMKAISDNYDLNTTLTQAINASVDMLLFGNQLSTPISIEELIARIEALVKRGDIKKERILEANRRIYKVKKGLHAKR